MRRLPLFALLALAGCGGQQPLPPPGAEGPILVRLWDARGERQVVIKAQAVRPPPGRALDPRLDEMLMERVLVRAPFADGVIYAATPTARTSATGERTLVLPAVPADGHVALTGVVQGQPVAGRAALAWVRREDNALVLEQVELVQMAGDAALTGSERVVVRQGERFESGGRLTTVRADPAVITALAALPRPLELPEITTR